MRWSLGLGRSNKSFWKMPSRGLWSVNTRKIERPLRRKEHFWIARRMAKHSNSMVEYLCCVGASPLEPHLTTLKIFFPALSVSKCPRAKPRPNNHEASVSNTASLEESKWRTITSLVRIFFSLSNAGTHIKMSSTIFLHHGKPSTTRSE